MKRRFRNPAVRILLDAVQYSAAGPPLTISAVSAETEVVVSVMDKGAARGFDARKNAAGTGMGLSIARDILQAHAGRIWVKSVPGRGSEFSIALPALPRQALL